jgi:hypothetical protein
MALQGDPICSEGDNYRLRVIAVRGELVLIVIVVVVVGFWVGRWYAEVRRGWYDMRRMWYLRQDYRRKPQKKPKHLWW